VFGLDRASPFSSSRLIALVPLLMVPILAVLDGNGNVFSS